MSRAPLLRYADRGRERAKARLGRRPRLAVVDGAGDENLGDEVMLQALRDLFAGIDLLRVDYPATESRLRRVGLSGPALFDGVLLGGGTLVNPHFHRTLSGVLDPALPAWALGTGVGSSGFKMPVEVDVAPWAKVLQAFSGVWVRGPLSAARLRSIGVNGVEVCGDLALALSPPEPLRMKQHRAIGVNLGASRSSLKKSDGDPAKNLAAAIRPLVIEGWTVIPFGMHPDDDVAIKAFGAALGEPTAAPVFPTDAGELWQLMEGVEAVVGVRLHSAVLAWMVGVPALLVAYRDKCRDFALQLNVDDCLVDTQEEPGKIEAELRRILAQGRARGEVAHTAARMARLKIESAAAAIREVLLEP